MSDVSNPIFHGRLRFPATQVLSSDANTLDDYEEGTWTPADASGAGLTLANVAGRYVKIGRMVFASARFDYPSTANGTAASISGLPFTCNNSDGSRGGHVTYTTESTLRYAIVTKNATTLVLYTSAGTAITNATMSTDEVYVQVIYEAAS
jgi:hypothetical protein